MDPAAWGSASEDEAEGAAAAEAAGAGGGGRVRGLTLVRGLLGPAEQVGAVGRWRDLPGRRRRPRGGELTRRPPREQAAVLGGLEADLGELTAERNQAMRFGPLPPAVAAAADLALRVLRHRGLRPASPADGGEPFNQMIVNRYAPGQGLAEHVDLAAFDDLVLNFSFESALVMDFRRVDDDRDHVPVLLRPGDLLALQGEARWEWRHGIAERAADVWEGVRIPRRQRTSVTVRRMRAAVHELTEAG